MARTPKRSKPARPTKPRKVAPKVARNVARKPRPAARAPIRRGFVGRADSPVLVKYAPKDPHAPVGSIRPAVATPSPPPPPLAPVPTVVSVPPTPGAPATPGSGDAPKGLISLDRPFDVDEFSQSLGETQLRVLVPAENLAEVLRRITDFMGFGIYVYSVRFAPEDSDMLRRYVVELQRVDYSAARKVWIPFEEKGRSDSPFGPTGGA